MDIFLPKEFKPGRNRTRIGIDTPAQQLCVEVGGVYYPVLCRWTGGFSVSAADVPALQGVVNLYDGATHLGQCLIVGREIVGDEQIFTVRRESGVDYAAFGQGEIGQETPDTRA